MNELKTTIDKVMNMAKAKGAEADCILDKSNVLSLKADEGELSEYKVSGSQVLGIRVIKDGKVGTSYSEALDDESLSFMVDQALENAKFSKDDPNQKIAVARTQEFDGTNERVYKSDTTPLDKKTQFTLDLESKIKEKDSAVKSAPYNNLSEVEHVRMYVNSKGTVCTQKERTFSCYTSALIEKNGKQSMHYHGSVARTFNELDFDNVIDESYKHANGLLEGTPLKTGEYRIVFTTDILGNFIGNFAGLFSGKGAMNGTNPWKDKVGEKIAIEGLSISDHPTYDKAFTYNPFDDEGSLTKETTLVENGVLKTFYHNSATADFFKVENTCHASRGPKGTLGVNGTNMLINAGADKETDLKNDEYFEIVAIQGLGSGSDMVSGDFSFGASGYLKKGDQIIQPVKCVTVSGNYFKVLNQISGMGDTIHADSNKTFFAPMMVFGGMTVGGQ